MKENIKRAIALIAAMPVTGDNHDLAVAAKNELRAALEEQKHEHEFDPKMREEKDGR